MKVKINSGFSEPAMNQTLERLKLLLMKIVLIKIYIMIFNEQKVKYRNVMLLRFTQQIFYIEIL